MGRPKAYDRDAVLIAARDLFWERGYQATSLSDLEERTGLNRSSLYQEFGSKHSLLDVALSCYVNEVVAALLEDLHGPAASLETIVAFFAQLAALLGSATRPATHGCLLVNTIAELAARDERRPPRGRRLPHAAARWLCRALTAASQLGQIDTDTVEARAELLAALLLGVWG